MADRRPLVAGLKGAGDVDPLLEKQFVFGDKPETAVTAELPPPAATLAAESRDGKAPALVGRVPLTTRVRADYASALKRASMERQLNGQSPNTLQDILEEALGPWLRDHGYIR